MAADYCEKTSELKDLIRQRTTFQKHVNEMHQNTNDEYLAK